MSISIITSDNLNTAVAETIEKARLAARNIGAPVFIIVPDRFTLQCERILMNSGEADNCSEVNTERQASEVLLNVRVVTFSMLYNILSEELNADEKKIIDKTAAVLYMWRAVQDIAEKLIWFNKSVGHYSFAEKMFNTINQLVSSMVDFETLEKNAVAEITRNKMHDIVLIRKRYKELTQEYTDGSSMLGFLIENIRKSMTIRGAEVFITGFEHLSVQRGAVVAELMKAANECTAGVRNGSEVSDFLAEIVFNNGLNSEKTICSEKAVGDALLPIFGHGAVKKSLDCCVVSCENVQEEAAWAANEIARLVKKEGARFREIVVTLGDYDHAVKIFEQTFIQNGIAVNADVGTALLEMPLALFVYNVLLFANNGKCENIIAVLKSGYCGLSNTEEFELENFCLKYNASLSFLRKEIEDTPDDLRTGINKFNAAFVPFASKLSKSKTANEISSVLLQIVESINIPDLEGEQLITENIAREKLTKLLNTCAEILGNQRMTLQEFSNMFGTLAAATKVSAVPTFADAVTLIAAKDYVPSFVRYLFVCGCNDGVFPVEQDDTDIITEYDIANMKTRIEPTATMQNNRARRHAVNVLSSFDTKLFVSHTAVSVSGETARPGEVVERIRRISLAAGVTVPCGNVSDSLFSRGWAASMVLRSVGDGTAFADSEVYNSILKAVDINDLLIPDFEKLPDSLSDAGKLFFADNAAGVTQFENFYKCPYFHFLQNGLKVFPRESARGAASFTGLLIHKIVELFLKSVAEKGVDLDVASEMKNCVDEALGNSQFAYFASEPVNKPIIASLKKQAKKIGMGLIANIKAGEYRPKYAEKPFEHALANGVKYRGIIDRVDVATICGRKSALIIDYKTGGDSNFSYKQLYLGTKLQLPLYMKALSESFELGGACYLPLRGGFSNELNSGFRMNGIVLNTDDNALALDKNLEQRSGPSGVVPLSSQGGKITGGVTHKQLFAAIDYATAMLSNAAEQMGKGYIVPSPVSAKVCSYCVCGSMCLHKSSGRGGNVRTMYSKDIERIMCGDGGDGDE